MKTKLLTLLAVFILLGGIIFYTQMQVPKNISNEPEIHAKENAPLFPDVTFTTPDGKSLMVTELKEPGVLVHFWAAWCAPCHEEFPKLLRYIEKANGKIALLSVSLDSDYADSQKLLNKITAQNHLSLNAPHLYWAWDKDKSISLKTFNTVKVPETIMLDSERRMVGKIVGPGPWDQEDIEARQKD